ncbi:MAG: ComEC/Rec2 family competence protein [Sedimentisphaeraceae bacterium JB056]
MGRIRENIHLSEYRINNGRAILFLPLKDCPFLIIATGLILGIVSQKTLNINGLYLISSVFLVLILTITSLLKRYKITLFLILGFFAAFVLGAARMYYSDNPGSSDISSMISGDPVLATLKGVVATEPVLKPTSASDLNSSYSLSFELKVLEILTPSGFQKAKGRVYSRISFIPQDALPQAALQKGERITLYCNLSKPERMRERWRFDFAQYLYFKRIDVCSYSQYPAIIREPSEKNTAIIPSDINNRENEEANALIEALTLGKRSSLSENVLDDFRTAGLMHILSLSGMHVGIIMAGLWGILRILGFRQKVAGAIVILMLTIFLLKVQIRPPVVRAAIIAYVFAFAKLLERRSLPLNVLSIAAVITLLIDPRDIFSPGWQLSFICVLGIVLLTRPIYESFIYLKFYYLDLWLPHRSSDDKPDLKVLSFAKFRKWFLMALSVSFAAWISSLPVIAYHFGAVYPFSWLYTILLAPLLWLTINAGFLGLIAWDGFSVVSQWFAGILIDIVGAFAKIPHSEVLTGFIPLRVFWFMVGTIILFSLSSFLLNRKLKRLCLICTLVLAVLIIQWDLSEFDSDQLRMSLLPVGHGQCVVLEMPGDEVYMLDCGSKTFSDCGRRIATPFLRSRRIKKLDTMIISHPDADHVNGVDVILEKFSPDNVFINTDSMKMGFDGSVVDGQTYSIFDTDGKWKLDIIPSGDDYSRNNNSLVVMIDYEGYSVMIPSDIEQERQYELLDMGIETDLLLMPHHSSDFTNLRNLQQMLNAKKVISTKPTDAMVLRNYAFE